jgi:hypothetical protein
VRLSRRSRTQHRLGVRIEESWPRLVAVLMVGGECSTESDSMRFRSSLVSKPLAQGVASGRAWSLNPWLRALLQAANRMSLSLTTPSPLLTNTFAQTCLLDQTFPLQSRGGPYIRNSLVPARNVAPKSMKVDRRSGRSMQRQHAFCFACIPLARSSCQGSPGSSSAR